MRCGDVFEVVKDFDDLVSPGDRGFFRGDLYNFGTSIFSRTFGGPFNIYLPTAAQNQGIIKIIINVPNINIANNPIFYQERHERFQESVRKVKTKARNLWKLDLRYSANVEKFEDFILEIINMESGLTMEEIYRHFFYHIISTTSHHTKHWTQTKTDQRIFKLVESCLEKSLQSAAVNKSQSTGFTRYYPPKAFP